MRFEFEHAIDEQNRIPVRQQREDLVNVEVDFSVLMMVRLTQWLRGDNCKC
ncbi:hypothetical protein C7S16_1155 [Burkholderia thailandensis]|uniref:Uncharacterized protein n=1 Tax=Burkholderia thailandensis TaxID=57975 RepID=A0AAW9CWK6_BURTH|nr:hypothetical protein [Burkholderia thailandensis]